MINLLFLRQKYKIMKMKNKNKQIKKGNVQKVRSSPVFENSDSITMLESENIQVHCFLDPDATNIQFAL